MKVKILMLLGLLMNASTTLSADDLEPKYYAGLAGVITPLLEYRPRGLVDETAAPSMNHYKVLRDKKGRLVSIRYFEKQQPSDDAYFQTHEVRYEYTDNKRIRRYYGVDGKPKAMWRHYYQSENVQKEEYVRNGNTITLHMYGADGSRVEVGTGSFEFSAQYVDDRGFIQTQRTIDGAANVIFDYLPFERSLITKDANGFLFQILNINIENVVVMDERAGFAEMRILFDEHGNELGWDFRDVDSNLVDRAATVTDPGYAIWNYGFDWENRALGQFKSLTETYQTAAGERFCIGGVRCATTRYVTSARKISRVEVFGSDGALVWDPDFQYAQLEISYDDQDRRTEMRYLDAEGALRTTGIAVRKYVYTGADMSPTVSDFDHKGQLMPTGE
jgi:hypothetical protein